MSLNREEKPSVFYVPNNFVDAGKVLGGMLKTRNLVEAVVLLLGIGYPIIMWTPLEFGPKIVLAALLCIPLATAALFGLNDGPLSEYIVDLVAYLRGPKEYNPGESSVAQDKIEEDK